MRVISFLMIESGTYDDMVYRPFTTTGKGAYGVTENDLNRLYETTQGGRNLNSTALAGVAGSIIRPSAQALGPVEIANGWSERRGTFLMAVEFPGIGSSLNVQYLSGHTDYFGVNVSQTGQAIVDPRMRLFFNNSVMTRKVMLDTGYGRRMEECVVDSSQLLRADFKPSMRNMTQNPHSLRPADLFSNLELGGTVSLDARTSFYQPVKKSNRVNGLAPEYLSRSLGALKAATQDAEMRADDFSAIMGAATGFAPEALMTEDRFLSALIDQTGFQEHTSIEMGELMRLDPSVTDDNVMRIVGRSGIAPRRQSIVEGYHQRGETEHWKGTNNETVIATILQSAVPAIMVSNMLTSVGFSATNMTLDGTWHIVPINPKSFVEVLHGQSVDLSRHLEQFRRSLETKVLRDLTLNNQIRVTINAVVDLVYDSRFEISVDGGPAIPFCTASFADGLYSPMITTNAQDLSHMANSVNTLAEGLNVDHSIQSSEYSINTLPTPSSNMQWSAAGPVGSDSDFV